MNILIITLSLLFFTGTHGRFLWMQDEPQPEPEAPAKNEPSALETIVRNLMMVGEEMVKQLDSSDAVKTLKIKENVRLLRKTSLDMERKLDQILKEAWKEGHKEITEKYPVFTTKVIPIVEDFYERLYEHLEKMWKEIDSLGNRLIRGIRNHLHTFVEKLQPIAESGRDKLRDEVEVLRGQLQPYIEDLRKEIEKAKSQTEKEYEAEFEKLSKQIERVVEEYTEIAKPYLENLKKEMIPHAEEVQKTFDILLDEIKSVVYQKD